MKVLDVLNLIYPPVCVICNGKLNGREARDHLCECCFRSIKRNLPPYCGQCGRSLANLADSVKICRECREKTFYYDMARSCYLYDGLARQLIHLLKYSGKLSLEHIFCSSMNRFLRDNPAVTAGVDAVIAVPLHHARFREREFNQAALLANAICAEFGFVNLSGCLERAVATRQQSELDRDQRQKNVEGAFRVTRHSRLHGSNLLLVDDLITTGSTLNECAKALKAAGALKINCVTFARGS